VIALILSACSIVEGAACRELPPIAMQPNTTLVGCLMASQIDVALRVTSERWTDDGRCGGQVLPPLPAWRRVAHWRHSRGGRVALASELIWAHESVPERDRSLAEPQLRTTRPPSSTAPGPWFATTAHGPDLFAASQQAVRYMIDHLVRERGLSREEAYILCSVTVDLKISEIVDAPNWIVSAFLPEGVFVA